VPTYEYACKTCEHQFEIVQSFADDSLTVCPECGGTLKKIFGNVGISFKGSGFYKNDSRSGSSSKSSSAASSDTAAAPSSPGSSSDSGSSGGSTTTSSATTSDSGHSHSHGASTHSH
jgi:putative FmdB family regulatory protein